MYILVVFVSNISFKRVIENDMIWWCQTPNWGRYFTLLFEVILNCHLYTRKGDWKICWLITPLSKDWWCLFTPILLHIYNITHYSASYLIVNQDSTSSVIMTQDSSDYLIMIQNSASNLIWFMIQLFSF